MRRNKIVNIAASLTALLGFIVTGDSALLFAALAVLSFLLLCGPLVRALGARTELAFSLKPSCRVGQELSLDITVTRPPLLRGSIELVFECRNVFLDRTVRVPVTLSPAEGRPEHFELPLDTTRVGRVSVELVAARTLDVFGFSDCPLRAAELAASYTVYPDVVEIEAVANRANRAATSGFVFDPHRKGQDLSEVFELREYRDGDSMRQVHWKLSARFEDLMVREPSHPADFDLAVGFAAHGRGTEREDRAQVVNASVSMLATVCRALLRRSLGHSVVYRHGDVLEMEAVDSQLGLEDMLDSVLATALPVDATSDAKTFAALQRRHGITKTVLVTDAVQESFFGELAALCELTVIYLGTEGGLSVDESEGYTLVRLSVEAASSRVKSLEL